MFDFLTADALWALVQVLMIDVVLAGDNAVVIGVAAAGLPPRDRGKAIAIGIAAATVLRIAFAGVALQLLQIIGLLLAGGILLLWVCWKLWRELELDRKVRRLRRAPAADAADGSPPAKSFRQAVAQIVVADVSMSLDNVLAVAGAAVDHPWVLFIGLTLSVALMGAAAALIANLLNRHRWIAYAGLLVILYVAVQMTWDGAREVMGAPGLTPPFR
jgi:YjbE family integral membrane protein